MGSDKVVISQYWCLEIMTEMRFNPEQSYFICPLTGVKHRNPN